jgi:YggT family protein
VILRNLLAFLVFGVWVLVLGRVLVSWTDPMARSSVSRFVISVTEPLLAPIRRVLPQSGMVDFSPLVLMLGLGILLRFVAL